MNNAVVGQSGGPTAAINATLAGVIKGAMECGGIDKIYGMRNGIAGFLNEQLTELNGYFCDGGENLELLCSTPAAALGSCRKKLGDEKEMARIFELFAKYEIKYFFYIGGNDSMDTVAKLSDYAKNHDVCDVKLIGVPKTIDNDLVVTDHTPGFGSAAKFVVCTMQEILRDCAVYTTKAVTIVEIMGRDAGWLTASSALTGYLGSMAPDFIYLPECAFDEAQFIEDIKYKLFTEDKNNLVIAVSEGIRTSEGTYIASQASHAAADGFGHSMLSGVGKYLEGLVKVKIGCKCRSVELNILQRCASHIASKTDIDESVRIGEYAFKCAFEGQSGKMVAFRRAAKDGSYTSELFYADVTEVANKVKSVPDEYLSGDGKGVNQNCIDYILPLINGEIGVKYKNGMPVHFEF